MAIRVASRVMKAIGQLSDWVIGLITRGRIVNYILGVPCRPSPAAYLLTYLLACLLTYLLTVPPLSSSVLTYLLTCLLTYLLACLLTYLLTYVLAYLPTCLLTYRAAPL